MSRQTHPKPNAKISKKPLTASPKKPQFAFLPIYI
jgi:hypothetical protein